MYLNSNFDMELLPYRDLSHHMKECQFTLEAPAGAEEALKQRNFCRGGCMSSRNTTGDWRPA